MLDCENDDLIIGGIQAVIDQIRAFPRHKLTDSRQILAVSGFWEKRQRLKRIQNGCPNMQQCARAALS
jgi:hypothetical protein